MANEVEVPENHTNCDHNILKWETNCNAPQCNTANLYRPIYVLHKDNYDGFCTYLLGISWIDLLKDCDTIESWEIFKSKMQEGMDKFISNQSACYVTEKPLWMSYRTQNIRNIFIGKKIRKSKLHADYIVYKKYQKRAIADIRKAKKKKKYLRI